MNRGNICKNYKQMGIMNRQKNVENSGIKGVPGEFDGVRTWRALKAI